jgi:PASTA domain
VAVLAAAVFPLLATTARADVMAAGTYSGQITGGTLTLGNGKFHNLAVPAGEAFSFTIPAGARGPVAWRAPAAHIELPLQTETDNVGTVRTAVGSLDISAIAGTVAPATGVANGAAAAHGVLRLTRQDPGMPAFSQYCNLGAAPSAAGDPKPLRPFALDLSGMSDTAFAANLDCGTLLPLGATNVPNIGDTIMASGMNALKLNVNFTRQTKCVVPNLKGLKLTKARAAVKKANCTVGKVTRKKSSRKATVVLKQSKKAGAVLAHGGKITLTIAR